MIYLLEPGATPPPPRPVSTSPRARLLLICGALLFFAIFCGGIIAMVEAGQILFLAAAGHRIVAHITHVDTPTVAQATSRIGITYVFDHPVAGGRLPQTQYGWADRPTPASTEHYPDQGHPSTSTPTVPTYHTGDRLIFRYAVVGGHVILHEWASTPYGMLLLLTAIGLTLIGVGALFMRRLLRWHRRRMRLLRHGLAVTGAVVSKRVDGLEAKYYLTYSYLTRTDTTLKEREEQCTPGQWKLFAEEEPVTVLYDPDQTSTVGLYKLLADP